VESGGACLVVGRHLASVIGETNWLVRTLDVVMGEEVVVAATSEVGKQAR
jgi:hypothetical protein